VATGRTHDVQTARALRLLANVVALPPADARNKLPTERRPVEFDLAFVPSDGEWKLIRLRAKVE
jgi:hypothetical protein